MDHSSPSCRLNELKTARRLLEMGADPNLRVRTVDAPMEDCHGAYDAWMMAQCYHGRNCLGLVGGIWEQPDLYVEMRALLKSYGAISDLEDNSELLREIRESMSKGGAAFEEFPVKDEVEESMISTSGVANRHKDN